MNELENISTRIPKGTKKRLKILAAKMDLSVQELVSEVLTNWLQKNEEDGK